MKYFYSFLLLMTFSVAASVAPIFQVSFEDTVVPDQAGGDRTPYLETAPQYRPGVRGKALLVGRGEGRIHYGVSYNHEKNLDWTQGAISFWLQPVNWKGSDTGFFAPFFTSFAGANNFLIYKYSVGEKFYFMRGELGFWLFAQHTPGEWMPGQWHHIVCQWDPVQLVMYVDGHLITERRIYFPLKNLKYKQKFILGETKSTIGSSQKSGRLSLMDEFKIYDRMLTLKEIQKIYLSERPAGTVTADKVTVPASPRVFTASGFTDAATDEYAVEQNAYSLSYEKNDLLVSLKKYSSDAKVLLTSPEGKQKIYPFHGRSLRIAMPEKGDWSGWIINIYAENANLREGLALHRDPDFPGIAIPPPFDLAKNRCDFTVPRTDGLHLIFDTHTTFNYGFDRSSVELNRPFHKSVKNIPDWLLVDIRLLRKNQECYRARYSVRKHQPTAVKFLYTLLDTREMLVAFQGSAPGKAVMEIVSLDKKRKYTEELPMPERGLAFFNLKFPVKASPGDYMVYIYHRSPEGKQIRLWDQEYRIPPAKDPKIAPYVDPDKDKLPPGGWTPVVARPEKVSVWGREYSLEKGLFFSSLLTQGKELLAEPDALILDGCRLAPLKVQVKKLSSTILEAVYLKTVDYEPCRVESRIRLHFDGYARITMTVIPHGSLKVKELAFEIPMKNDRLKLVRDNRTFGKVTGLAGDSFTAPLLRIPMLWVGDYYTGINFTAENLVNWHYRNENRHIEMKRDQTAARVRFLLVSAPLDIRAPRQYDFGLTVTPVKPLNRKLLRIRHMKDSQIFCPWYHMTYLDPYRIKTEPPWGGMDYYRRQHTLFPILLLYSSYNFAGPFWPEWTWYEEDWRQIKHGRTYGIWTGTKPYGYCEGCINGADYRNFRLNMLRDFIQLKDNPLFQPGSKHFYFDAPWEESCYNPRHGCRLWKDPRGKLRTHVLVDVFRDKAINVWRMIKRVGDDSLVTYHSEWQRIMPYQAFQDFMFGGEGMELEVSSKGAYYDVLTPDSFNATFSPYLWSAKMILIPQVRRGLQLHSPSKFRNYDLKKPEWRRSYLHMLGLAAVNDTDLCDRNELCSLWWKAQDELGWDEKTVFHPYYADEPALVTTPHSSRIVASAYTHSGRLMLVILNDTDQEKEVTVQLDLKKLGVRAGLEGREAFTPGLSWKLAEKWQGRLGPRGLRMILFK